MTKAINLTVKSQVNVAYTPNGSVRMWRRNVILRLSAYIQNRNCGISLGDTNGQNLELNYPLDVYIVLFSGK